MLARRIACIAVMVCIAGSALAAVPPMISYQGKLMQPSGAPVPDGTYSLRLAIYDAPTAGNTLWSEPNDAVQVKGGLFSVLLGSVINMPANIFDSPDRFFGVKVGSDPEMTPRQRIASVGYAVKAASADIAVTVPDRSITAQKLALGTITADILAPGVAMPSGTIVMWSGAVANIPLGWKLCDGTNATPDLRNRFVVGAGDEYVAAATGGEKLHQLSVAEMPSHNHGIRDYGGYTTYQIPAGGYFVVFTSGADLLTNSTGGDQPHENRPPYYALCFIMRVGS